ncbi:MAG: 30S ribosomal protein S4 [Candidatus Roizmanbacteria bacterium]|nr:30S ribosomal protein S4 [Candidatus Roizmanbacteria bacterium]
MSRISIPKNKQARREGVDLSLKTPGTKSHARLLKRLNVLPGNKTTRKFRGKISEYGKQLREKQKLKRIYVLNESKMARYFREAVASKGNSILFLIQRLELRLDNVVYRAGLAPTRNAARQLVSHGHVTVNGKKITIPSYPVSADMRVAFGRADTYEIPYIKQLMEDKNRVMVDWLNRTDKEAVVKSLPSQESYAEPVDMSLVIEFYSKL